MGILLLQGFVMLFFYLIAHTDIQKKLHKTYTTTKQNNIKQI
jgi:hypothetical protein